MMLNIQKILIPVVLADTSRHVVHQAAWLARHFHAEIILLHVVPPLSYPAGALESGDEITARDLHAHIVQLAQRDLDQAMRPELDRGRLDVPPLIQAIHFTGDRAGLLYSGDVSSALTQLVHEDAAQAGAKLDTYEAVKAACFNRPDVRELMSFAISDDYFRLRAKLKLGLGV